MIQMMLLLSFCLTTQQLRFPYIHSSHSSILLPVSGERTTSSSSSRPAHQRSAVKGDAAAATVGDLHRERVQLRSRLLSATSFCVGMFGLSVNAFAAADWTDRNRLAAETWRAVDEIYLDRTFNGQDWFRLRQDVVKRDYKSDEELYSSLKSMVSKLGDRYTRYLTPAQYSALVNSATGELIGLGAELIADDAGGTVIARMEDASPAKEAGLMQGDRILNVDGVDTSNSSPEEVAAVMRGKLDSKVGIRISRSGVIVDKSAIRKQIKLKSVSYSFVDLPPPVGTAGPASRRAGYIKLRSFSSTSRDDVTQALEYLHSEDSLRQQPLDALVVDLRDNGGGLLQGAVEAANLLLPPGKIVVFVVSKDGSTDALQTLPNGVLSADPALPDLRTPCFILVNSNTASAAEVFAAAMKENARARLVGEKTFGKGIIQNLQPLRQGGVAVTTARYETPLHHDINKLGTY